MGGEVKREAFDLTALKNKMEKIGKPHEHQCHSDEEECKEYLLEYPLNQRRCVAALENLHLKRVQIEAEFRAEVQELEKKYLAKYQPLYSERTILIKGLREPKAEEYGEIPEDPIQELNEKGETVIQDDVKGLPSFWMIALKNHPAISEMITESDLEALSTLEDIKIGYLEGKPGFRLEFIFGKNDFFTNECLTKEYHLAAPTSPLADDFIYDHAVGSEINWVEGKNLCFKTVTKTQRQKNGKGTRVVKREEPQESFFHFFNPPTLPEDEEDSDEEADVEELEQELEADYEMGDIIKSEIVPNAIHWFTGKALDYADYSYDDEDEYDEEFDEEDSEENESDSDASEDEPKKPAGNRRAKPQAGGDPQQCKQQ